MGTDEMLNVVRQWLSEREPGEVPDCLIVRLRSGRKAIQSFPTVASTVTRRETGQVETDDEDDPPVVTAILRLIGDSDHRLTSGTIIDRLVAANRDEVGFSDRNIGKTLTRLVRDERLVNHVKDPNDGLGRGYGMPEWESR